MNEVTSSLQTECNQRLDTLYRKHHKWLGAVAFNVSQNHELTEELVGELYLYLGEKCNPKLFYLDSFNLQYCRQFIISRFINGIKRDKKQIRLVDGWDTVDEVYDYDRDEKIDKAYDEVKQELDMMKKRKGWSSAMIYEHYWFSDKTLDEVSKDIRISKSTTFLAVKKTKTHLKKVIKNPFEKDE